MDALNASSRQLLSTVALLTSAFDYNTVAAFNPHSSTGQFRSATEKLAETLQDLECRGFVQYNHRTRRYDLHPVVRGVASGGMRDEEKKGFGQRVVDHLHSQPHPPYAKATTMGDVANALQVVRTLLQLGRHQQAADAYQGDLSGALFFDIEGYFEKIQLLRPFFHAGWGALPRDVDGATASY
jgi:hypothetical protein